MKFRNRFLKYARPQFNNNDVIELVNYAPNAFCMVDEGGETPPTGETPPASDNDSVTVSSAQLTKMIADGIAAASKPPADDKDKSAIDKINAEKDAAENERTSLDKTRKTIAFDMGFDKFIDDNSRSFNIDKAKFRQSAEGLDGEQLEQVLSATAAKDFFSKAEHIELLPQRDRDYINDKILKLADNAIDYRKAFQLIEDALHIKKRVNENNSFRKNAGDSNIDNTDTPNVTAYLEKCTAAGKPAAA